MKKVMGLVGAALAIIFSVWFYAHWPQTTGQESAVDISAIWGQFGDSFGFLTSLVTALAFGGMIWSIVAQKEELGYQREELNLTRKAMEQQTEQLALQKEELVLTRQEMEYQREELKLQRIAVEENTGLTEKMVNQDSEIQKRVEYKELKEEVEHSVSKFKDFFQLKTKNLFNDWNSFEGSLRKWQHNYQRDRFIFSRDSTYQQMQKNISLFKPKFQEILIRLFRILQKIDQLKLEDQEEHRLMLWDQISISQFCQALLYFIPFNDMIYQEFILLEKFKFVELMKGKVTEPQEWLYEVEERKNWNLPPSAPIKPKVSQAPPPFTPEGSY